MRDLLDEVVVEITVKQKYSDEQFECGDCGCYFWVEDRNDFDCPNCKETDRGLQND